MKSKRAKACNITLKVKQAVYERDLGLCVICHKQGIPNAHYIRRSQGRIGYRAKRGNAMSSLPQ